MRPVQLVEARCVITFQNDQVLEFQDCTDTVSVSSNLNLFLTNTAFHLTPKVAAYACNSLKDCTQTISALVVMLWENI